MLNYDPVSNLQHFPIAMSRFGLNPQGAPLYRIVFAPSRRYLVVGEAAEWRVLHKQLGPVWIMERWLPAEQFAKCTRDEWNRDMLVLGPWPEKGEYELCHVFDTAPPADASIETLIAWIEAGRQIPFSETRAFHQKDAKRELLATRATAEDMIRNRLPAFGVSPMVGFGGGRGSKTAPLLRSAQELGLPTKPTMLSNGRRRNNPVTRMIEAA